MQSSARSVHRLVVLSLIGLQLSCGGDSSGPGTVATTISANSSTTLTASPGAQVSELPSVIVHDQAGAPMSGVPVTFSATVGGGSVTGGSQVTNAQGIATVGGWTMGITAGTNTLVASAGSLPSVTFTANTVDPCANTTSIEFGTTASGNLSGSDCRLVDGSYVDFFVMTVPAAGTYLFSQSSTTFDTFLALFSSTGVLVGLHDDINPGINTNSAIRAILPAGNFRLWATSYDPNTTGSYTVSSASSTAGVTNCEEVFVVRGSSTAQELQSTDCATPSTALADDYFIFLAAGQSITVAMASSTFDSYLELYSAPDTRAAFNDNDGGSNDARMTFTASAAEFYLIRATSAAAGASGAYTLRVD